MKTHVNRFVQYWLHLWNGHPTPSSEFQHIIKKTQTLKAFIKTQPCPQCTQKESFTIVTYEEGSKGWEMRVICEKCHTSGIINDTGFHIELTRREIK